jgi:cysteinyl-tRNA synthetase
MAQADEALKRLMDFLARLDNIPEAPPSPDVASRLQSARDDFAAHVLDDLNTAAALGVVFDLVRALNSLIDAGQLGGADVIAVRETFDQFDAVLGVLALRRGEDQQPPVPVAEIERLIDARREARRARNFAEADRIRAELDSRGIILEDTGTATRWKRK